MASNLFNSQKPHSYDELLPHIQSNGYTVVATGQKVIEISVPSITGQGENKVPRLVRTFTIRDANGNAETWEFMQTKDSSGKEAYIVSGYQDASEAQAIASAKNADEKAKLQEAADKRQRDAQERANNQALGLGPYTNDEHLARQAKLSALDQQQTATRLAQATAAAKGREADLRNDLLRAQTEGQKASTAATASNAAATTKNAETNEKNAETQRTNVIGQLAQSWARSKAEEMIKRGTLTAANAEVWIKNQVEQYKAMLAENDWIVNAAKQQFDMQEKLRSQDVTQRGQDVQAATTQTGQVFDFVKGVMPFMKKGSALTGQDLRALLGAGRGAVTDMITQTPHAGGIGIPNAIMAASGRSLYNQDPTQAFDLTKAYEVGDKLMEQQMGAPVFQNNADYAPEGVKGTPEPTRTSTGPIMAPPPVIKPPAAPEAAPPAQPLYQGGQFQMPTPPPTPEEPPVLGPQAVTPESVGGPVPESTAKIITPPPQLTPEQWNAPLVPNAPVAQAPLIPPTREPFRPLPQALLGYESDPETTKQMIYEGYYL